MITKNTFLNIFYFQFINYGLVKYFVILYTFILLGYFDTYRPLYDLPYIRYKEKLCSVAQLIIGYISFGVCLDLHFFFPLTVSSQHMSSGSVWSRGQEPFPRAANRASL